MWGNAWGVVLWRVWLAAVLSLPTAYCQTLTASDGDTTPCGTQFTSLGTCTWTGACPLAGCQDRCVADLGVGYARTIVTDRAYDPTWFQLCPRLAQIVDIVEAQTPSLTQSPASPSAQTSARRALSTVDTTEQPSSRLLRSENSMVPEYSQRVGVLQLIATGTHTMDSALSPARKWQRQLEEVPSGDNVRQACPEDVTVDAHSTILFALAGDLEDIFIADANGEPLTSTQQDLAYILDEPNEFAVLIDYMKNPEQLKEYMASSCTTSPIPSSSFRFYDEHLTDGTPPFTPDVVVCRDTFNGLENHLQLLAVAGKVCQPPFTAGQVSQAQPECFATLQETPWTPTSEGCAVALARAYNISDAPLRAAAASITSLHELCQTSTTKADCSAVDGTPQRTAIQAAWDAFPVNGMLTASSQATTPAATLTFGNPLPKPAAAQDAAPAPDDSRGTIASVPTEAAETVDRSTGAALFYKRCLLVSCCLVQILLL